LITVEYIDRGLTCAYPKPFFFSFGDAPLPTQTKQLRHVSSIKTSWNEKKNISLNYVYIILVLSQQWLYLCMSCFFHLIPSR